VSEGEGGATGYAGPAGLIPVPYSRGVFNLHWFQFYNAICFQIVLGAPTVLLAKDLGASSLILGILAAFMPLMTALQLPAARHLGRHSYRSFALGGWTLRSVFIAVAAAVPLLDFLSREGRLFLLVGTLFFFNLIRGISSTAFLPWITGMVAGTIRGRFLALDQTFLNGGLLIAMVLSSLLMRGRVEAWRYSLVLGLSLVAAVISIAYLRGVPDVEHREGSRRSSEPVALQTMAGLAPFRNCILFNLLFVAVTGGLGVFPIEYLRVQAGFSPSLIYALTAVTFLGPMLALRWVGIRVDRLGSIPAIRVSLIVFAAVLAFWFALSSGLVFPGWRMVLVLNLIGGAALAVFNMANGHLIMGIVPETGKNHYFAVSTVVTSFGMGLAPILWGWLLDSLGGLDFAEGPLHIRRHSVYFLGITLLAIVTFFSCGILSDPKNSDD